MPSFTDRSRNFLLLGVAALVAAPLGCAAPTQQTPMVSFVGLETVAPEAVTAGDMVSVSCLLLDETGATHAQGTDLVAQLTFSPAGSVTEDMPGVWVAKRSGKVEVGCAFASLSLIDATPSSMLVN